MKLSLRLMRPHERRYVVSTWVQSFAAVSPWSARLTRSEHWPVVDRILDRDAPVMVLSTEGGAVHGWACGEGGTLHYAYIPPELRERGLGRRVIEAALGEYGDRIDVTHPWPWQSRRYRWNPYLLLQCERRREAA